MTIMNDSLYVRRLEGSRNITVGFKFSGVETDLTATQAFLMAAALIKAAEELRQEEEENGHQVDGGGPSSTA